MSTNSVGFANAVKEKSGDDKINLRIQLGEHGFNDIVNLIHNS